MGSASRAVLEERQGLNLARLVTAAQTHSPFYRDRLAGGRSTDTDRIDRDAFRAFPILTRETVRQEYERMKSNAVAPKAFRLSATGGSTGTPMPFYTTSEVDLTRALIKQRMEDLVGIRIGDRRLKLWGSEFDVTSMQNVIDRLKGRAMNQRILPAFELTEQNLLEWLDLIDRFRPRVFEAYTDTLVLLAKLLIRESRTLDNRPVAIIAAAEGINEVNRGIVQQAFGAPVLSRYGTRELGNVAHECLFGGMHIAEDRYLVEVVDDRGRPCAPGQEGRFVITDMTNTAFPFIRYDVGDMGSLAPRDEPCRCGRAFRRIVQITGRAGDQVELPDGRRVTPGFFPHLLKEVSCIQQYRIIQDRSDHLCVLLRLERELSDTEQSFLTRQIERHLPGMQYSIERRDVLPVSPSGKHRVVENLVGRQAQHDRSS
jgi:phenylacetate-CoA ligase